MHITHLSLVNFRNYLNLEFDLPDSISIFQGANAQGKTNLLESICFLATTRFSRSVADREIINRGALTEKIPFLSTRAEIAKETRNTELEIILRPRSLTEREAGGSTAIGKHIKINGVGRRSVDLMGQLNMVMFSPRDIELITDEPALRRRYLDITNSQVNPRYLRSLQRYNKVISQRNHLLRQIAAGHSRPDELDFWDEELVHSGAYLVTERQETVASISKLAFPIHSQLSGGEEKLDLKYIGSLERGNEQGPEADIEEVFTEALRAIREKEILRGQSLTGPHRDDLQFLINDIDIGHFGSRGQQRTVALSLKLAEAQFMLQRTGETPVLLLDDVLSELDKKRREHLLEAISGYRQVLITTTDLDRFPSDFLSQVHKFEVRNGTIL
ncbi:MAG: DNA replication/repair protein RecF [Dehalococcoidia bacterium]